MLVSILAVLVYLPLALTNGLRFYMPWLCRQCRYESRKLRIYVLLGFAHSTCSNLASDLIMVLPMIQSVSISFCTK